MKILINRKLICLRCRHIDSIDIPTWAWDELRQNGTFKIIECEIKDSEMRKCVNIRNAKIEAFTKNF